jgi:hypothetical protein
MDTYNMEWDPSFDPIDETSWVDDSFWDDFDMDNLDTYENGQLYDQDTFDVDTMIQNNMDSEKSPQNNAKSSEQDTSYVDIMDPDNLYSDIPVQKNIQVDNEHR